MKINKKIYIYAFLLFIFMQSVFSIGISPASTVLNFEPGLEEDIKIRILNNEHKDFDALIEIDGDLKEYVVLEKNKLHISADEYEKSFTAHLKLPSQLKKPGRHVTEIVVIEQSTDIKSTISARLAVASQLIVNVPYPEKYAEATLNINRARFNEPTQFAVAVFNLGKEDLTDVWAKIEIYEGSQKIKEVRTDKIKINSKDRSKLSAYWIADTPGIYKAVVTVYYADKTILLEKEFDVGSSELLIDSLNIYDFKLGQIVRMYTTMTNKWNKKLQNVYEDVEIRDEHGNLVSKMKSASINIEPFSTTSAVVYWDTKNLVVGKYTIDVTANYDGLKTGRTFDAYILNDEIIIDGMPTGKAVADHMPENKIAGIVLLLIIIIINLIIINVLLIKFLKKRPPKIEEYNPISKLLLFLQ